MVTAPVCQALSHNRRGSGWGSSHDWRSYCCLAPPSFNAIWITRERTVIPLRDMVARIIALRRIQNVKLTLLAVCPNSVPVLEAAVKAAAEHDAPMLFAATLNQVDRDGGYTGWTPAEFVREIQACREKYHCHNALYPCLDHGGPWLKDAHTMMRLPFAQTLAEVKQSLTACLEAGYSLLHIDPTVDRSLPPDQRVPIGLVVERTIELIAHAETERCRLGLTPISYEVGTEEVHGGLVDLSNFQTFVRDLRIGLLERGLEAAWPCFIVAKVGTDLHTTFFDRQVAARLTEIVAPFGSLLKGHYTDWVANPEAYPQSGMGGANVGPEFTTVEYQALCDLLAMERERAQADPSFTPSRLLETLEIVVCESGRWKKWLQPGEETSPFTRLAPDRKEWLVQTGCRYIWTDPRVVAERQKLYANLAPALSDPHQFVVDRIAERIGHYIHRFNLSNSTAYFTG